MIDWLVRCHATVKSGGNCWGTDACYRFNETYYRDKAWLFVHGGILLRVLQQRLLRYG